MTMEMAVDIVKTSERILLSVPILVQHLQLMNQKFCAVITSLRTNTHFCS